MVGSASFEANFLAQQGEQLEQENQAVQIANVMPSIADSVWDFDQDRTTMMIKGLFDARSTRRIQVIDPLGKVYVGMNREHATGEPVQDAIAILGEDKAQIPQTDWNDLRIKTLHFTQLSDERWQVVAPLWQNSARDKNKFLGHLVVEYSLEDSIARSHGMMIRLLVGGFIIASLIIILLSLALQYFVLMPVKTLMVATQSIADGRFDGQISIPTNDEMSILAQSFESMRVKLKDFTFNLQDLVRQRTLELEGEKKKIQNILIHINEGILTFDSDFVVGAEISDQLTKVLHRSREKIVGQNLFELVFADSLVSSNDKDEIKASLDSVLDEDALGFEANGGHLPEEIVIRRGDALQILDLDWVPIIDESNGIVHRMMLTIRDITEKRMLEQQMVETKQAHETFLRNVGDIVQVGVGRTRKVLSDAEQKVSHLSTRLQSGESVPHQESFPLLHTIKGNLRSLGFSKLVEEIHLAEEVVLGQRQGTPLNIPDFIARLKLYQKEALSYHEVLTKVWGDNPGSHQGLLFSLMDQLMVDIRAVLAREHIPISYLEIKDHVVEWSHDGLVLMSDLLVHSLTNSLDHGYLRPKAKGIAPGPFAFSLEANLEQDRVHLHFQDGGRGISRQQIEELYRRKGTPVDSKHPYNILFENSISTADEVTTRSGRGVGLFTIRELVLKNAGEVYADSKENGGFTIDIYLPHSQVCPAGYKHSKAS